MAIFGNVLAIVLGLIYVGISVTKMFVPKRNFSRCCKRFEWVYGLLLIFMATVEVNELVTLTTSQPGFSDYKSGEL